MDETAAIVLAAGKSTRMLSDLPKVLHEVCGRPMLAYVLSACRLAGVDRLIVVVGYGKDQVLSRFEGDQDVVWVEQTEQKGTGHAVQCCRDALGNFDGSVLIVAGDMPLVRRETLSSLLEVRMSTGDAITLATTELDDPTSYGRIVRDDNGDLGEIVEHVDATPEQREIREVNPSYYCADGRRLFTALDEVKPSGSNGEYYVTDVVRLFRERGDGVSAKVSVPAEDAIGINSRLDLAMVNRVMEDRIQLGLMNEGVTIVDPDNTWIESDTTFGRDSVIYPFSMIGSGATIGEGCRIGPFAHVAVGETVANGTHVGRATEHGAQS